MKKTLFGLLGAVMVVISGCKSDVDLKNINTRMDAEMGIAVPIGNMKVTFNDFLHFDSVSGRSKEVTKLYANVEKTIGDIETDCLFFRDTFTVDRDFHPVDLSQYSTSLHGEEILTTTSVPIVPGVEFKHTFDIPVTLDGLNQKTSYERIDSIYIQSVSLALAANFDNATARSLLKEVTLIYPDEFYYQHTKQPIPDKPLDINTLFRNDSIYITLNDFVIDMRTDKNKPCGPLNVKNVITFHIKLVLSSQTATTLPPTQFSYGINLHLGEFEKVWGFFKPGNQMRDSDFVDIAEQWSDWENIKNLKVRFKKPRIELRAIHDIESKNQNKGLDVTLDELYVADEQGTKVYARFGDSDQDKSRTETLYNMPITNPRGDEVFTFWYTGHDGKHDGDIDRMFDIRPDSICYKYHIDLKNEDPAQQFCLNHDTKIHLDAIIVLPAEFKENSYFEYSDTADVDFSSIHSDSIKDGSDFIDTIMNAQAYIYITAFNHIPFDIVAKYVFLDENLNPIKFPLVSGGVEDEDGYIVTIPGPKKYNQYGIATEYGENTLIVRASKQDLDEKLSRIRHISYEAKIEGNPTTVVILSNTDVKMHVGVAANVQAIMDFNKKEDDKK